MRWIVLALALLISGSASAQVGQIVWPPITKPSSGGGGGSCASATNTEVQTWGTNVDGQGGAVSPTQCGYVDTLITSLKTAVGSPLSSNVSRLWLATSADTTAGNIQAQFKVDVIHGSLLDFTNANIGARLAHTTGYTGNGSSEYIITPFIPSSSDTGVFGINSASMAAFILSSGSADGSAISSNDGSTVDTLTLHFSGSFCFGQINSNGVIQVAAADYRGLNLVQRTSGAGTIESRLYNNATPITATGGDATFRLSTVAFYLSANNAGGTPNFFSGASIGAALLGRGMNATESDAVATALNAYMTSVGAFHW